jgi:hypothetical protein
LSGNDLYFQVNILNALSLIMVFHLRSEYNNIFVLYTKILYLLPDLVSDLRIPVFENCLFQEYYFKHSRLCQHLQSICRVQVRLTYIRQYFLRLSKILFKYPFHFHCTIMRSFFLFQGWNAYVNILLYLRYLFHSF